MTAHRQRLPRAAGYTSRNSCRRILPGVGGIVALIVVASAQRVCGQEPAPVNVAPVVSREVATEAAFVATVHPLRRVVVGSAVEERVVEFLDAGDDSQTKITRVRQGQALAKLRTGTIEIELAAAKAERQLREQAYEELRNGSRPEEIAQALAKREAAEAHLQYARAKYQRRRVSPDEQPAIVSGEEVELAMSEADVAEQAVREASAAYDLLKAGPRGKDRPGRGTASGPAGGNPPPGRYAGQVHDPSSV